jgi:hypothetical protein
MSRTTERSDLPPETRFLLAERDLDDHTVDIEALSEKLGKMLGILVGILVSTTTAAILLALNLVATR